MDGLSWMAAGGAAFKLKGGTRRLLPLTLGLLAEAEHMLVLGRRNPVEEAAYRCVREGWPDEVTFEVLTKAVEDTKRQRAYRQAEFGEVMDWLSYGYGRSWSLWACLRSEPDCRTLEQASALIDWVEQGAEFVRVRDRISGLDAVSQMEAPEADDRKPSKRINWKLIARNLSEGLRIAPPVMREMTLMQAMCLLADPEDLTTSVKMTLEQARMLGYLK